MQRLRTFALLAVMSLVMSCDSPTEIRTGSIRIALLTEGGTPALIDARKGDLSQTPDMRAAPTSPNVLLDAVQVRVVGGAVDRTVTSSTPTGGNFLITIPDLPASSYTVTVTGLVGGLVAHLGETAGVVVTAGQTQQAGVTFPVFQPVIPGQTVVDTSEVLSFDIAYAAVTGATSYRIEWDQNPSFTAPLSKDTTGLGARIAVTAEGNYYVRVRALRGALVGLPTPTKGVYLFQGVATVTVTPASPTILAGATQQLTAVALDAAAATVAGFTWFWSSSNQGVALVSSTGLVTGVSGGAVTITAMAKGTPGSAAVAVTARPAAKLAFNSQPGNAAAGAAIPAVRVTIQDATGATVTADNTTQVSIAIGTDAGGGVLGGLTTVSAIAGVATFANLAIPQAGAGYTLVTTATGLTAATSAIFNIAAGAATQLAFTVEPTATAANAAMSPAVQVTVRDALGNRVSSATDAVTIAISTNPGTGVLGGTQVVNAVSGVASFSGLSINQGGAGYILTASATGRTSATSAAFNVSTVVVVTPPATKLAFSAQPGNAVAGATIPTVRVAIQDAAGATVTSDNTTQVSIAIGTDAGPGGVLGGLATVSAVAGIATFSALTIPQAGAGYTLVTTATGLTAATSAIFNIAAGAATQLAFTVAPSATAANAAMSPAVQVTVRDALGNRVSSATDAVTIAISTNPGTGVLGGTKVVNAVSGVASFSGLSIDQGGTGYILTASATGRTSATSGAFDVSAALPATVLAFSIQPASGQAGDPLSPAVQVEIRNANGERVTTARNAVTLNFQANPGGGTITGTKIVNAIDGIASFTGLAINKSANGYTFAATSGSLTAATSTAFNITPGAPTRVRFLTQPANAKGNVAQGSAITAAISDAFDNTVTSATSNVTLALGTNPWRSIFATSGGGTVSATSLTVAAVAGVATFANVRVDKPGVGYTLAAASAGITSVASSPFNVNVTFDGQVGAGGSHTCAISTESGTYCWGANGQGQLGSITGSGSGDSIPALVTGGLTFVSITSGANHTCGLLASGAAYCWGYNFQGQLGNGTTVQAPAPVAVSGGYVFAMIDVGGTTTCGVTTASGTATLDRQVYCWGAGGNGELGNAANSNSSLPVRVSEPLQTTTRALSVSLGLNHVCAVAVSPNSQAYCWGYNGYGQLGTAAANFTSTNVPTQVNAAATYTWTSIASGYYHTCGISSNGGNIARCWGYNYSGSLGDNLVSGNFSPIPVTVAGSLTNWTRITAGGYSSCGTNALTQCWGANWNGQLGIDDQISQQNTPTLVAGSLTITNIEQGIDHACGKTGTGASSVLYCWGYNGNGRLGSTGVNTTKRAPTLVVQ